MPKTLLTSKFIILILSVLLLTACVKEPEGPAEQIGRGIDLITKGLGDIDQNQNRDYERQRLEEEERLRKQRLENNWDSREPYRY